MQDLSISHAGMRIIKLLVGEPPRSVADLIREMKVTRTAITEQLNELVAAGLVERKLQRLQGRGRPRHVYSATTGALLLLHAANQRLVFPAIWRAIHEIGGTKLTEEVIHRVSAVLARHYLQRIRSTTPAQRLSEMTALLQEEGVLVDMEEDMGRITIRQRSCPFIIMFEESRAACLLDREIFAMVAGAPVKQVACRHDGAPCCVFEVVGADASANSPAAAVTA
ncbi:MAG: MarR family transcriptional regulator [Thermogutta sp.]|nr:MarR family transcriptional regulator [Thermogutta sp.]